MQRPGKKIYSLKNTIQHYDWGTRNEAAFIPKLLGNKPEKDLPYAELWIGSHQKAPSVVENEKLSDLIDKYPVEIMGEMAAKKFGKTLPFLLKVLSAGEALSIQAHPDKSTAASLHARDPLHYPDDNHKPEIAIALDSLIALMGFKSFTDIITSLEKYRPLGEFVSAETLKKLKSSRQPQKALKQFYSEMMLKAEKQPEELAKTLQNIDRMIADQDKATEVENLYSQLRIKYGDDVGLFSLFLLNLLHLKKGEAVYLKAGIPHAYLKGNIIECMANSDNVVRAGLTPKFKDIGTLTKILTYETGLPKILKPSNNTKINIYKTDAPEFIVTRKEMAANESLEIIDDEMEIIIIIDGKITAVANGEVNSYKKGEVLLIPAILKKYKIETMENTTLFSVKIPGEK